MYVRGNPLRYTDPSGHCAVLDDGSADREGDAGCWQAADEWYNTFEARNQTDRDEWIRNFASRSEITEDILFAGLFHYWRPIYVQMGIFHVSYNPQPTDFVNGPQHPIGPITESAWDVLSGRCEIVDCTGLALDVAGFGGTVAALAVSPLCGPGAPACAAALKSASTIGTSATVTGLVRTATRASKGKASAEDVIVTGLTTASSLSPKLAPAGGFFQVMWDIFGSPRYAPQ